MNFSLLQSNRRRWDVGWKSSPARAAGPNVAGQAGGGDEHRGGIDERLGKRVTPQDSRPSRNSQWKRVQL